MTGAAIAAVDEPPVDFVVVDVETACHRVSSICQIGIVGFRDGRETFAYETLVDPLDLFAAGNIRIHGITAANVAGQPSWGHVHDIVDRHLAGRITVAHSLFDKGALAAAARVHGRPTIATTWLDSVRVARRAWPHLSSHRLNVLTRYLGLPHKHHDALSDARAAGMVVVRASEHAGVDLAGWLRPVNARGGPAPPPAADGPLAGHRVAILGAARDSLLGVRLAAAGARVMASVGTTSTMLVIGKDHPFGRFAHASPMYRRALELRKAGQAIEMVDEVELERRLAVGTLSRWKPSSLQR